MPKIRSVEYLHADFGCIVLCDEFIYYLTESTVERYNLKEALIMFKDMAGFMGNI
jgi:hypothetical protein